MLLKLRAVESMQGGSRRREVEVAGGVMALSAGCGAMLLGGNISVMLLS
jgi:hypothetical protein